MSNLTDIIEIKSVGSQLSFSCKGAATSFDLDDIKLSCLKNNL
jgi:hypothetical protein